MTGNGESQRTAEVSIHGIGAGGVGVGTTPGGRVAFVPRTAPGDRVRMRYVREKSRWVLGEALEFLELSPSRRPAPCSLYDRCDGCSLQHLPYPEQLRWKGRIVGDALRRIGGFSLVDPQVQPSSRELRYRNKVTLTLRRLPGQRVVAGFRELWRTGRVLNAGGVCLLPSEDVGALWRDLQGAWGPGARLLPAGKELRLTLRGFGDGGDLLVKGGRGDGDPMGLVERLPGLRAVWRDSGGGPPRHLAGDPALRVHWFEEELEIRGGGFLQVNQEAGEQVHAYVLAQAGTVKGLQVLDAYAGTGVLGRELARRGANVVGIEADPAAAASTQGMERANLRMVVGLVEEELDRHLPVDLVIVNPPRSGMATDVPRFLRDSRSARLIYVSCDPATLARDLKRLGPAYRLVGIRAFDLFPQTSHVETVVTLVGKDD